MPLYLCPDDVEEAVAALASHTLTILAGGTDFYPARVGRSLDDDVLDITRIPALHGIDDAGDHWRIGAATTWSEFIAAPLPRCFDGLKLAAREVGGRQIQNAGTVVGNLCNASPAADGVPPLLALDASVELASAHGLRVLPLHAFLLGNRRTARRPDELALAVRVPKTSTRTVSHFIKLGARRYLLISIAMAAVVIELKADATIAAARVAVGACSAVAQRLPLLEQALAGLRAAADIDACVQPAQLAGLAPLDDVRAGRTYRLDAALTLVRRTLREALAAA